MRRPKLHPTGSYGLWGISVVLRICQEWIPDAIRSAMPVVSGQVFWTGMLALLVGLLWADLSNPGSGVRNYWRWLNRIFDVRALYSDHIQDESERVVVVVLLNFIRRLKAGEIVITVTTETAIPNSLSPFVIYKESKIYCPAHDERRLTLCSVRVPRPHKAAIHSLWGNVVGGVTLEQGQKTITPHSKNLVRIAARSGWKRQHFDFIVDFLDPNRLDKRFVYLQRID